MIKKFLKALKWVNGPKKGQNFPESKKLSTFQPVLKSLASKFSVESGIMTTKFLKAFTWVSETKKSQNFSKAENCSELQTLLDSREKFSGGVKKKKNKV